MANPLGSALGVLVFLLCFTAWLQIAGAMPMSVQFETHFIAFLGSAIMGLFAYAWAEQATSPVY